jgi:phosphonatase-like hydrolase
MRPALVVFDMIGTTIAWSDRIAVMFAETLRAFGADAAPGAIAAVRGLNKAEAFRRLAASVHPPHTAPDLAGTMLADFRARLDRALAMSPPRAVAGAEGVLAWLTDRGVATALTSGLERDVVDRILTGLGWSNSPLIRTVVSADDVARGRPAPDLIHEAMRRCGLSRPAEVLVVGDTVADLESAAAAGAGGAVGVLSGAGTAESLGAARPAVILESVAGLPAWLESRA